MHNRRRWQRPVVETTFADIKNMPRTSITTKPNTVGRKSGPAIAIALFIVSWCSASQAEVFYYCTDKSGNTWMTDHKKPGTKCKVAMVTDGSSSRQSATTSRPPTYRATSVNPALPKPLERPLTPTTLSRPGHQPDADVQEAVVAASQKFQIPQELIHAVIQVESGYDPTAVSRAGAMGLMQLMPATAAEYGVVDLYDARQNIMGGTKYLRWLANYFSGDIIKILAAYHAGLVAVNEKNGIPYSNTEAYVKKVLSHYYRLKDEAATHTQSPTKP